MKTLFSDDDKYYTGPPNDLGMAMIRQWEQDQEIVKQRRIWPDWRGEPRDIAKDKAALLNMLYESGYIVWNNGPSKNKINIAAQIGYKPKLRYTDDLLGTTDDPMIAVANVKALIDECEREGLISSRMYNDDIIYEMEQDGEFVLEDYMLERELDDMDPIEGYMRYDADEGARD